MTTTYVYSIEVPLTTGPSDSGIVSGSVNHDFPTNVLSVTSAVKSFTASYGGSSHKLVIVGASCDAQHQTDSTRVTVTGSIQLQADSRSNSADPGSCHLKVSLTALCE